VGEYDDNPKRSAFLKGVPTEVILVCALCGGAVLSELAKNIEVRVVMCEKCSLAFLSPRLTKEGNERFYGEYFQEGRRSLTSIDDAVRRLEKKNAYENKKEYVREFTPHMKRGKTYIEIGAGWGTLAKRLQDETGATIEVVEPSTLASEVARAHYKLTSYKSTGEDFMENAEKKYDGMVLVHVFEHLLSPNKFLERARTVLNDGAYLFLALPDLTNMDEPMEKYFHIEHTIYYTPQTLTLMMAKHGFLPVSLTQDIHEMRAVFRRAETPSEPPKYDNREREAVERALKALQARYGVLRRVKVLLLALVPRAYHERFKALGARAARKLGIVKH
jgi:2-polyprenyl-3-methyl-5-hydroxy-6-metoxy-1,4-benzoquinol methylase